MLYIFVFFILFYILNGIYYLIGFYFVNRDHRKVCLENSKPFVSIVVAARNEAKTIRSIKPVQNTGAENPTRASTVMK